MSEMHKYPESCDYLRSKFNLDSSASIYKLVNTAVEYIKELEISQTKEKEQCQKKSTQSKSQSLKNKKTIKKL